MSHRSRFGLMSLAVMPLVLVVGRADARQAQPPFLDLFFHAPWMPHAARKPAARSRPSRKKETERELYRELHRMPPPLAAPGLEPRPRIVSPPLPPRRPSELAAKAEAPARIRTSALAPGGLAPEGLAPGGELDSKVQRELQRVLPQSDAVPESIACAERLAKIAHYRPLPRRTVDAQCAAVDLVQLDRIIMPDRSTVTFAPAPTLQCGMAEAVAEWVRSDVAGATAELGAPLAAIADNDSYHCRPRNNVAGAKLSEHGKGNALDVTAVKLRNGRVLNLTDRRVAKPFRERMRADACARFSTVLGPGDPYHADHIHLDLAQRSNGYKICQWDVLEPMEVAKAVPLPPRRPAALTKVETKRQLRRQ
ncbi:MAG: extensin family protein [Rhizobiales bacterium]|nr:extensin family protein [Hyphomicrobiales bacterium]